jgi:NTE family protein
VAKPESELKADLVLSGGGVKGVALAGAVAALTEAGYEPQRVSGTSAGGIIGAMVAAGLRGAALGEEARKVDYQAFLDPAPLDWVPLLGSNDGIYAGKFALRWITDMLAALGVHTWRDLALPDTDLPPEQRYKLVVTCADLTHGRMVRLPWDYHLYGLVADDQPVAQAVRASMSVPLLFRPVTITDPRTGAESTLVDGGIVSNFPIDSLDRADSRPPRWPTFGVTIIPDLASVSGTILPKWVQPLVPKPVRLLEQVAVTSVVGRDQANLAKPAVRARSMTVDASAAGVFDFALSDGQVQRLFQAGHDEARRFLDGWDWQRYLAEFRT